MRPYDWIDFVCFVLSIFSLVLGMAGWFAANYILGIPMLLLSVIFAIVMETRISLRGKK